jgi:pyruvate dehydrogenase E1 component alpha subunit
VDPDFFPAVEAEADKLAVRFRAEVRALPDVPLGALFDHVYTSRPPELAAQRAELTAYAD